MPSEVVAARAWAAKSVQAAVVSSTPANLDKWQAIQEGLSVLPPDSLRELMIEFWRSVHLLDTGKTDPEALEWVIQRWYEKATFARAQAERPVNPEIDMAEWPDRSFA